MDGLGVLDRTGRFEDVGGEHGSLAADHALLVERLQGQDRLEVRVVADRSGEMLSSLGA